MKKINKLSELKSLTAYRRLPDSCYDGPNFGDIKDDIRDRLLLEQGHLCAYCMRRINKKTMKIEHFYCQDEHSNLDLNYNNMLGCCPGGEGSPYKLQTCDTRKGNKALQYSPSLPKHDVDSKIRYASSGKISSYDEDFDTQINDVLNLNLTRLKENRVAARYAAEEKLNKTKGTRSKTEIQKLIDFYKNKNSKNHFTEYYGFVLDYLRKKYNKAS